MAGFSVCSVVARNYLPRARVLARSFTQHHPDVPVTVVVIDAPSVATDEPFRTLALGDIGLGDRLGHEMAGIYDLVELATAVKPWVLEHLISESAGPVLYLDPDIEVFGPLDGLATAALDHGIAVTPHVLHPVPRDGNAVTEANLLAVGMFNLGFIGIGPGGVDSGFLTFWKERLRRDAVRQPEKMLFTDQRWVDFIHLFPHVVIDDPGCNVAWWNAWERPLTRDGEGILVAGRPLRFFHFSGFDPAQPQLLSTMTPHRPRVLLSEHPILAGRVRRFPTVGAGRGSGWSCIPTSAPPTATGSSRPTGTPTGTPTWTRPVPVAQMTDRAGNSPARSTWTVVPSSPAGSPPRPE
jgi:hypothetical protein